MRDRKSRSTNIIIVSVAWEITKLEGQLRSRRLQIHVLDHKFELDPDTVALAVDVDGMVDSALQTGRSAGVLSQLGWWLSSLQNSVELLVIMKRMLFL